MHTLKYLVFASLLGSSTIAMAQKANADFDQEADFSQYKTYAYEVGTPAKNPLSDKRVTDGLAASMAAEGLTKVEANPDLHVTYHGSTSEEVSIDTTTWGYNYGPRWSYAGPSSGTTTVRKYTVGTLVVDIWDAKAKKLVWRGTASDTLSDNPEKNQKKLKKALEKLFKKYPPEKKK